MPTNTWNGSRPKLTRTARRPRVTPSARAISHSIAEIDAATWNALGGRAAQPFLRHEFLLALEESAAPRRAPAGRRGICSSRMRAAARWRHAVVSQGHSRGEFVFDFSWANAYAQHGIKYYPKLLSAVPFTPVTRPAPPGRNRARTPRRDRRPDPRPQRLCALGRAFLVACAVSLRERSPGVERAGLILRRDCQFHWYNRGYESFDDFLATFTAEKRKKAKRERRRVAEAGIEFDTRSGAR